LTLRVHRLASNGCAPTSIAIKRGGPTSIAIKHGGPTSIAMDVRLSKLELARQEATCVIEANQRLTARAWAGEWN